MIELIIILYFMLNIALAFIIIGATKMRQQKIDHKETYLNIILMLLFGLPMVLWSVGSNLLKKNE